MRPLGCGLREVRGRIGGKTARAPFCVDAARVFLPFFGCERELIGRYVFLQIFNPAFDVAALNHVEAED